MTVFARSLRLTLLTVVLGDPCSADPATSWFSISGRPEFVDVQAQLRVVVDEHARQTNNHFCVVGEMAGGFAEAWVYWRDGGKLILWRPDRDNPHAIAGSNRYLDLHRDIVAGNDVGGSTYKLTRSEADRVIRVCTLHGDEYTIEKRPGTASHG